MGQGVHLIDPPQQERDDSYNNQRSQHVPQPRPGIRIMTPHDARLDP
jgi:hypothetical protein